MIEGIRISYVGEASIRLATVQHLGLAGKDQLDGALKTGDVQRFVGKVEYENVAHAAFSRLSKRGILGASLSNKR